ncbi:extracellular solute-binding protein [Nonomuraea sp. KC401]|uniref:ABC transporter substrate-binding protein n=1 Tax=unclassified Nonomuraea TaxID=2593643 RepID=UPI0010FEE5A6|nr:MULTISPECIES: extracellular solute-binding protein [unclassified Nonomuraea]NBE96458.1 extracellular solute-binding protein [Nonomuraea sp. K271]TLF61798.1 extracellular solute-binding protein [Nonomuraea sp. KC401]
MQRSTGLLLVTVIGLAATACGSGESASPSAGGAEAVTITVACQPAKSAPKERKAWDDDVATFMKNHPGVTVKSTDQQPCFDPKTFGPKLAGGQMETVFVVPVTNYADIVGKGQALDITPYTSTIKNWDDLRPDVRELVTKDGKVYGVPNVHYGVGLVYNRALFTKAGLDPNKPPATWAEVREAAKKIAALGQGYVGYGEYSGGNTGGWHFTQAIYGRGGSILTPDNTKAAFNSPEGKAVLQTLHDMRWVDDSMGDKLLVGWESLMMAMGSGKVGMMLGAPDVVTDVVNKFRGNVADYGITGFPEAKASLSGGEAFMINPKATPEEAKAGLAWLDFRFNTVGKGRFDFARGKALGNPVGVPDNDVYGDSPTGKAIQADRVKHASLPVENYEPYVRAAATVPPKAEPVHAQELYAVLDVPMSGVLSREDASIDQLLADAETKANSLLAAKG